MIIYEKLLIICFTIGVPTSNNDRDGSDSGAIIGRVVGGVILLLTITVMLGIVILCMRRSYRKKKFSTDDKVYYDYMSI